jgi:hypothetical protein
MLIQEQLRSYMNKQYLPLMEYSSKHRVSISTLRRRIKADDINFVFKDGKYLILDEVVSTHQRVHRPSPEISEISLMGAHKDKGSEQFMASPDIGAADSSSASAIAVANQVLAELKKAYTQILSEKEEQILFLKEELADLKTLARVLESENERLSNQNYL